MDCRFRVRDCIGGGWVRWTSGTCAPNGTAGCYAHAGANSSARARRASFNRKTRGARRNTGALGRKTRRPGLLDDPC